MPRYEVTITRLVSECCTVEVEADSPDLAKHLAVDVLSELEIDPWEAELGGYMGDPTVRNVEELN